MNKSLAVRGVDQSSNYGQDLDGQSVHCVRMSLLVVEMGLPLKRDVQKKCAV